jgi:hypothetical protein
MRASRVLAAAAVLIARTAAGGVLATAGAKATDPGRPAVAGEHGAGGKAGTLAHGLQD